MTQDNQNGERRRTERLRANAGAVVMAAILVFSVFTGVGLVATQPIQEENSGVVKAQSNGVVYSGDGQGVVKAVYADNGSEKWSFSAHSSIVKSVSVSPDGDTVYSVSIDTAKAIDADTGKELWVYNPSTNMESVIPSPDGGVLYFGYSNGVVKAIDADTRNELWSFSGHSDTIDDISVSPDNETVYSASWDESVKAIDAQNGTEKWTFNGHTAVVNSIAASPDGETVYSIGGYGDSTLRAINATSGNQKWSFSGYSNIPQGIAVSPDSEMVYTGGADPAVKAIYAGNGTEKWSFSGHTDTINTISVSPDGGVVYSGSSDRTVKAIDANDGTEIWTFGGHSGAVRGISAGYPFDTSTPTPTPGGTQTEQTEGTVYTLDLNTRSLFKPNATQPYEVIYTVENLTTGDRNATDVTDSATVTSNNTSVLTVDSTNATLSAVNDENISVAVNVTANYTNSTGATFTDTKEVVVAQATVENLKLLPTGTWRLTAVLGDSYFQALLVAMFAAVIMTRFTSAFGGLAGGEMVLVIGWFAGYVPWVYAALGLFTALFIGLNLAANIDYTVRR